jgi:hypothetical protein
MKLGQIRRIPCISQLVATFILIQLDGGITHAGKTSMLHLCPVGSPRAQLVNLEELHDATHDMLCRLQDLHNAGYVHNDLRWDNCIKGEWKWVIIDLEYVGKDREV